MGNPTQYFVITFAGKELYMCVCVYIYMEKKVENESRSVMPDSVTPWTAACQAPLSMEFSRHSLLQGGFPT